MSRHLCGDTMVTMMPQWNIRPQVVEGIPLLGSAVSGQSEFISPSAGAVLRGTLRTILTTRNIQCSEWNMVTENQCMGFSGSCALFEARVGLEVWWVVNTHRVWI